MQTVGRLRRAALSYDFPSARVPSHGRHRPNHGQTSLRVPTHELLIRFRLALKVPLPAICERLRSPSALSSKLISPSQKLRKVRGLTAHQPESSANSSEEFWTLANCPSHLCALSRMESADAKSNDKGARQCPSTVLPRVFKLDLIVLNRNPLGLKMLRKRAVAVAPD